MSKMRKSMKLRKTPGGEETGREAPIGFQVTIRDRDPKEGPKFFKVRVDNLSEQPEGWVAADSVDEADNVTPIDKDAFANECWHAAIDFGSNAHYLVAVATLRSDIAEGTAGAEVGPFRLLESEWAADWGTTEPPFRFDPAERSDWSMQCQGFALMASQTLKRLEAKLPGRPNSVELLLAQMAGIGVAAQARQSDASMLTLITQQDAADLPPGQKAGEILDRFAKWFKKDGRKDGEPVTGKVAFSQIEKELQAALLDTRQRVESTGTAVIDDVFAGVQPTSSSIARIDLKKLSPNQQRMAQKILDAFAKAGFGAEQQVAALANAYRESTLNPDNVTSTDREHSVGLFQLNMKGGLGSNKGTEADLKDPDKNIAIIIDEANKSARFKNAKSLRDAITAFVEDVEKPGNQPAEIEKRLQIAEEMFGATQDLQSQISEAAAGEARYVAQNPERWMGQAVGTGQCVAYVREASGAPRTSQWRRAGRVKGDREIPQGAAIATFDPNGSYGNHEDGRSHAAIYIAQNENGLTVYDQWKGQVVHQRVIRFGGEKPVNNGDEFYLIG
jgi:hypothetical protein